VSAEQLPLAVPALRLIPLCAAVLELAAPLDLGTAPTGRRVVAEITAAGFRGERFTASMTGAACADWYTSAAGGMLGLPDVRITVRTADGALVLIRYTGRVSTPTGRAAGATAYVTPVFETGDQRYDWLNHVQAVGKGRISPDARHIDYAFFELR
jgi:hypothetical protein